MSRRGGRHVKREDLQGSKYDPNVEKEESYPCIVIEDVVKVKKGGKKKAQVMRAIMGTIKERWEVQTGEGKEVFSGVVSNRVRSNSGVSANGGDVGGGGSGLENNNRYIAPSTKFGNLTKAGRYLPADLDYDYDSDSETMERKKRRRTESEINEGGGEGGGMEEKLVGLFRMEKSETKERGGKANLDVVVEPNMRIGSSGEGGDKGGQVLGGDGNEGGGGGAGAEYEDEDRWEEGGEQDYTKNYEESDDEEGGEDGQEATF